MIFREYRWIWQVKKYWIQLEEENSKNIYQTYAFNALAYIYRRTSLSNIKRRNLSCRFIVGLENNKPVCIAPLIIDTDEDGVIRLLGHGTNVGYLDYIYRDSIYVQPMHKYVIDRFSKYKLDYIFVKEQSPLVEVMTKVESFNNYMITTSGYEDYFSNLSKSTRQNIRTAYNRLNKDGKNFEFKKYTGNDDISKEILRKINCVYQKRKLDWNNSTNISDLEKKVFLYRDVIYRGTKKIKNSEIVVLYIENDIAAFMIDFKYKNGICIPRLAIDTNYSRYSPGVILINEYLKNVSEIEDFQFDLCRGDEKYKSSLGGICSLTYRLC